MDYRTIQGVDGEIRLDKVILGLRASEQIFQKNCLIK